MNISEAIELVRNHHLSTLKRSTNTGYQLFFNNFKAFFPDRTVESLTVEEVSKFLESFTAGVARGTRHLRYAQTKAFFSFVINECGLDIKNPCAHSLLMKQYKNPKPAARKILDKELVDELIYSTSSTTDRLILELQARCRLRIGEVLKLRADDVTDRKLLIREPKSGKESKTAFMPEQIAKRMAEYITVTKSVLMTVCFLFAIRRFGRLSKGSARSLM
jgi:integrase/recombinase XerD